VRPFAAIFVPDDVEDALSDRAWLRAMLDAERALALAGARAGLIPADSGDAIAAHCDAASFDVARLAVLGRGPGNPVEPLVRKLRELVGGVHAECVHRGATSQDILDTAAVLVARAACGLIDGQLATVADRCAALAEEHRRTGAAGTLAAAGTKGMDLLRVFAAELELPEPTVPWHTVRTPFVDLAGALASTAVAARKIATDVTLLAQTEVAEVAERDGGVSSTMPDKRNPVGAVLAAGGEPGGPRRHGAGGVPRFRRRLHRSRARPTRAMSRTVVLSGSLGSTSAMWDAQLPVLRGRRVVRIEHPGHGGTPAANTRTIDDLAQRALAQVEDGRFSFVGLSLGGAVGLQLALSAPERIEGLVVACSAARFGEPAAWTERAALVRSQGLEAIVDAVLGRWFTPAFGEPGSFREMFLSTDRESYASCCEAIARWDLRDRLGAIEIPTLVIAAAEDPSTPPALGELIAGGIPGARFELIAGAAHLANVERPDDFNQLLEGWL
jgi:3-oxoadipate enol-lactonase